MFVLSLSGTFRLQYRTNYAVLRLVSDKFSYCIFAHFCRRISTLVPVSLHSPTFAPQTHLHLKIKIINQSPNPLPRYETTGSAGMDLRAWLPEPLPLQPLERGLVPTGLFIELPEGYEAQVRPRSGLAIKRGLTLLNSPGTIDTDYRGEIKCIVVNLSNETQVIETGERIAQLVIARFEQAEWLEVAQLESSERGEGGFGSTGKQ
jgi:dUTP pyrophosphatase